MKNALVVHPWFPIFGGGELICLYVIKTLQEEGYKVTLVSDVFQPEKAEEVYQMGDILKQCDHIKIPGFNPRKPPIPNLHLYALQGLFYVRNLHIALRNFPADIVFCTQTGNFKFEQEKVFHFLYDTRHLYTYPSVLNRREIEAYFGQSIVRGIGVHWQIYYFLLSQLRRLMISDPKGEKFLAVSHHIQRELVSRGFTNSSMIYPPARLDVFHPRPKKKRVVITCRIDPAKNLEGFFTVARKLPEYEFVLVGRHSVELEKIHKGYARRVLALKPPNVQYVDSPLRMVPELLEESQVYLYTGIEPGIGIAIMEAAGAGCIPIAASIGGGAEVVQGLGAGYTFKSLDEAVRKVRIALESPQWTPEELRERALKIFGPDVFTEKIKSLVR